MTKSTLYPLPPSAVERTHLNQQQYQDLYQRSITSPDDFWAEQAHKFVSWFKPWDQVANASFETLESKWFIGGKLNAAYNCLDKHLEQRGNQIAILWEGDEPNASTQITYLQLHEQVCRLANVLKQQGIKKGDRVCIYLPMMPEIAVAMLACARIGAIHSVVFGGFSAEALKTRILDSDCRLVITADEGIRGGKLIPLKQNTDQALVACPNVSRVIVIKRTGNKTSWNNERDIWYYEAVQKAQTECEPEWMDANDPLFILYTSGSTGKPKGILHSTGGYLVYAAITHYYVFDYHEGDIYWCTADAGWITGHSYVVYGPLLNGATTLLFEGVPHYPNFSRFWQIIDKYKVNIFYTAPTAIRALRREGDTWVTSTDRNSLKLLGTVGEPMNPEVWEWYFHVVGNGRCPVVDTWWQTETGGILITPLPGVASLKPGSVGWPFFGIEPAIVDDKGNEITDSKAGKLVIKTPWPGFMQTIYNNPERFFNAYFREYPGFYLSGDEAYKDNDGYYWVIGRNDDILKVSGHRIGTGELESALLLHPAVAEAAVVAIPHEIKGNSIYAFVTVKADVQPDSSLKNQLIQQVRNSIGAIAAPEFIQWATSLPKTRSGKIMRRILRKIACDELEDLGDISTLADPGVIKDLICGHEQEVKNESSLPR